jgi:antitoxin (DNA-binding transcriptional repressor) of toxin-antitoxin stability system
MKTVSVRDLRYDFPKVEELLKSGEEIRITKRKRVIARLTPEPLPEHGGRPPLPDFLGRMRANFGDRIFEVTGAEIISADRDDRF